MENPITGTVDYTIFPKVSSVIILPTLSFLAGIFPLKLGEKYYKAHENGNEVTLFEKVMTFFSYFGGGVLLCTIFLHLMPEIRENVQALHKDGVVLDELHLSFPELVLCIGFFVIFSLEELLHTYISHPIESVDMKRPAMKKKGLEEVFMVGRSESSAGLNEKGDDFRSNEQQHINHVFDGNKNYDSCTGANCQSLGHRTSIHSLDHIYFPLFDKSVLHGFVTVMALSVHELFEGLAVGLEPKPSMVWYLLTAISCHKVVLAAFIGVQLLLTQVRPRIAYVYVLAFAATSPVGIIAGILMTSHASTNNCIAILSVTLQSMATGTLLYIVFFEVYAKQFSTYILPGTFKVLSSITGFMFMAFLQMALDEE